MELRNMGKDLHGQDILSLKCSKEEYEMLHEFLKDQHVVLKYSSTDLKTYNAYVRNPAYESALLWGDEICRKMCREIEEDYRRFA